MSFKRRLLLIEKTTKDIAIDWDMLHDGRHEELFTLLRERNSALSPPNPLKSKDDPIDALAAEGFDTKTLPVREDYGPDDGVRFAIDFAVEVARIQQTQTPTPN